MEKRVKYIVEYAPRNSWDNVVTTVEVSEIEYDGAIRYYATQLGLWGCGKNASTPENAIRALVQDMATIKSMKRA